MEERLKRVIWLGCQSLALVHLWMESTSPCEGSVPGQTLLGLASPSWWALSLQAFDCSGAAGALLPPVLQAWKQPMGLVGHEPT